MPDRRLEVVRLGRMAYAPALELQHALVEARAAGAAPDRLLLLEHEPVVTLGRGFQGEPPAIDGVAVVPVERGGLATYHGPGQLVGYPIVRLEEHEHDLHAYLHALEQGLIDALATFDVDAVRRDGATGVWLDPARARARRWSKIASIGVAVRRWVAFHGFALNVTNEPLTGFAGFDPCGFEPDVMTSIERERGDAVHREHVLDVVAESTAHALGRHAVSVSPNSISPAR